MIGRGLGAILPTRLVEMWELAAHRARMEKAFRTIGGPLAPTRLGVPDIRNQGGSLACFAFAGVYGCYFLDQVAKRPAVLASPYLPYWWARRLIVGKDSEVVDGGSDPDGMIRALRSFGACDWDVLPFDPEHVNGRVGHVVEVQAQKRACSLEPILEVGTEACWTAIQYAVGIEKKPVIVALEITESFDHPMDGVVGYDAGENRGLHAQCVYGVDPDGALLAGSWGLGYGGSADGKIPRGCVKLTPQFIKERVMWAGVLDYVKEAA